VVTFRQYASCRYSSIQPSQPNYKGSRSSYIICLVIFVNSFFEITFAKKELLTTKDVKWLKIGYAVEGEFRWAVRLAYHSGYHAKSGYNCE
jgi:hypothetical protein